MNFFFREKTFCGFFFAKKEIFVELLSFTICREMQEELQLSKFKEVVNIVLEHNGCIFGGFLRDFVMQKQPRDMDVVLYYSKLSQFDTELKALGYTTMDDLEDDELEYNCDGRIPIHVVVETEEQDPKIRLSPCPIPDYDVNLLAFDNFGLFNWMDMSDPSIIIQKIHNRVASAIKPNEDRIKKFKLMRFTEIPHLETKQVLTSYQVCKKEIMINKLVTKNIQKSIEKTKKLIQEQNQQTKQLKIATQKLDECIQASKRFKI
jgi:hypothetical protein